MSNNMSLKKSLGIVCFVALASLTLGVSLASANGNGPASGTTTITKIESMPGGIRVYTAAAIANPGSPTCSATDYYFLPATAGNHETGRQMIMAAYLAGRPVSFWLAGCEAGGDGGLNPRIWAVRLH